MVWVALSRYLIVLMTRRSETDRFSAHWDEILWPGTRKIFVRSPIDVHFLLLSGLGTECP